MESITAIFSEAFKREKIKEMGKGVLSIAVLCKLHSISRTTVYKWIYLYSSFQTQLIAARNAYLLTINF